MKIDSFANIQLSTVHGKRYLYRLIFRDVYLTNFTIDIVGREPIKDTNDVIQQHRGVHISPDYLHKNMYQLNDLFSIPQVIMPNFGPDAFFYFGVLTLILHLS